MTVLRLDGLRKSFGETLALDGLDLEIRSGLILGVAGPNGSGKSTLVRVLAGEEYLDAGSMTLDGGDWSPAGHGGPVAVVHQEPMVWPNLTLAENLSVGREGSPYRYPELSAANLAALESLDLIDSAGTLLRDCSLAVRQRAEIARAVARNAQLFLFDEPNSALTERESSALFVFMHGLADNGRLVVLVSHRLGELVAHCGQVIVIRDGRRTKTLRGAELTEEAIARELVVGRARADAPVVRSRPSSFDQTLVAFRGWSHADGAFQDVTLEVRREEVLAVVGVEGSGARELVASIAADVRAVGSAEVGGHAVKSLADLSVYLSADRRGMLFQNLSVAQNLVARLGIPEIAIRGGLLRLKKTAALARELIARFGIRASSPDLPLPALSGGNQQKVAIAAALAKQPSMLVLEEPARGVDVGAKAEIYAIIRGYARSGHAVVIFCTEVPEVFELADRVGIVDDQHLVRILGVPDFQDVTALAEALAMTEHTHT